MSSNAKEATYRRQLVAVEAHKAGMKKPVEQRDAAKVLPGRALVKIVRRCQICGRSRAVYRKFGCCRICFRKLASDGLIPGVRKASW